MRLKVFEARTMQEAMAQMRAALGPDALILDSRYTASGVSITASVEAEPELEAAPEGPSKRAPESAPERPPERPVSPVSRGAAPLWPHREILTFHNVPEAIIAEMERRRRMADYAAAQAAAQAAAPVPLRTSSSNTYFLKPEPEVVRLDPAQPELLQSDLARSLNSVFQFGALSWDDPVVLAGPPGAGKTLSLVKLAIKLVREGRPPLVINADTYRAAALPQLAAFTRLLDLELVDALTLPALEHAMAERDRGRPVLIDSPGINPFLEEDVDALRTICDVAAGTTVLVLPGGLDPAESADLAVAFFECGATKLIPTRLDLTRRLGGILAAAAAAPYVMIEAGIGSGAADGIASLTPDLLAQYLYRPHASFKASESTAP